MSTHPMKLASLERKRTWFREFRRSSRVAADELLNYLDYLEGTVREFHLISAQVARKVGGDVPKIAEWEGVRLDETSEPSTGTEFPSLDQLLAGTLSLPLSRTRRALQETRDLRARIADELNRHANVDSSDVDTGVLLGALNLIECSLECVRTEDDENEAG